MGLPVLTTKLNPPRYSAQTSGSPDPGEFLPRPGLLQRLNSVPPSQTILVYGPEGCGKTSLLSAWKKHIAGEEPPNACAWLSLDDGDNDPARFLAGITQALHSAYPGLGANVRASLETPQPPHLPSLLSGLICEIAAATSQIVLILDNFESLRAPRILQATGFVANNLPANARLVIASSSPLPTLVEGLRLQSNWSAMGPEELQFSPAETSELLGKFFRTRLNTERARLLTERTQGLALGIHLAALALQRNPQADQFWKELNATELSILEFLTDKVLERQMEAVRDFLMFTSLLNRLNGELCDEILRVTPAGLQAAGRGVVTLGHLLKNRILTTQIDDKGEWYQYHSGFAKLLLERLAKQHPGLLSRLHYQASQWLRKHNELEDAFTHALASGDEEWAIQVIEDQVLAMVGSGQISTILTWLGGLSASLVLQHPWLCLAEAWATVYEGWKTGVDTLLSNVELAAYDMSPSLSQRARGHVAAIRLQLHLEDWDVARREELARRALEQLPIEDYSIRSLVATQLGMEFRQRAKLDAAAEAFTESVACATQSNNRTAAITAYCRLTDLHLIAGRLQKALALSEEALGIAQAHLVEAGYPLLPSGLAHIYAGLILYERDELAVAQGHIETGTTLCKAWGALDAASLGQVLLATILKARGSPEKAHQAAAETQLLLQRARQEHELQKAQLPADPTERNVFLLATQLNRTEARLASLYLDLQEKDLAAKWLNESGYGADDAFEFPQAFVYVGVGKVLLSQGRTLEARRLTRHLALICENAGANYTLIHALVLQSQVMQLTNDYSGALASLKRALLLSENEKLVRPFFEVQVDLTLLLKRLSESGPGSLYARSLLSGQQRQELRSDGTSDYSNVYIKPQTRPLPPQEQAGEVTFTDREREILRLLGSYLSVVEIASHLEISDRTADTIIRNICRKLGVRETNQAVVIARTMKLI